MQTRDNSVDILKAIAIFFVLMIHTLASGIEIFQINTVNWYSTIFWGSFVRCAVPLFFMCSGALLLNPKKEITIKKLYTKNIPRIIIALFFWASAYEAFSILIAISNGTFYMSMIKEAIKRILLFDHHFQLYFLHIMIIVYMFLPATRVLCKHLDIKTYKYILVIWSIVTVIYPFIIMIPVFQSIKGVPRQWILNFTYGAIGYTMLGDYMNRYSSKKPKFYALVFLSGVLITIIGMIYFSNYAPRYRLILWDGASPTVLMMAYGLYGFIKHSPNLVNNLKFTSFSSNIAKASFCIFLIHDFFNIIFRAINITINNNAFFMIPAMSILNMILSFIVYLILRRIPVVKTYLI